MKKLRIALASLGLLAASVANAQQPAPAAAEPAKPAAAAPAPAVAAAADASSGTAAWYGRKFAGRKTASGQRFNPNAMTAAHPSLPFGTRVKVTNRSNGRSVVLRVNDRGPTQDDRVGDVSQAAAHRLGMVRPGVVEADLAPLEGKAPKRG